MQQEDYEINPDGTVNYNPGHRLFKCNKCESLANYHATNETGRRIHLCWTHAQQREDEQRARLD